MALGESVEDMVKRGGGQGGGPQPVAPGTGGGSGWSLLLGIIELLLVMGLVAVVIYLLIRFLAQKTNGGRMHPLMRTISVHPLATNRAIHMVLLEDRVYVIGVGEDVTLLDVIADEELVERIKAQSPLSDRPELPAWLPKWVPVQRKTDPDEDGEASAFSEALQSKLRQLKDQRKKIREWDSDNR